MSKTGVRMEHLDRALDRWLDDPRSDTVTLVVGVSIYLLFWAAMGVLVMVPMALLIRWLL